MIQLYPERRRSLENGRSGTDLVECDGTAISDDLAVKEELSGRQDSGSLQREDVPVDPAKPHHQSKKFANLLCAWRPQVPSDLAIKRGRGPKELDGKAGDRPRHPQEVEIIKPRARALTPR
jgi:hypothetical protein